MGNSTSSPTSPNLPSPPPPPAPSRRNTTTPRAGTLDGTSKTTAGHALAQRRSIELNDVDISLKFTSTTSNTSTPSTTGRPHSGRKLTAKVADIEVDDDEPEGTLRGAMLGKASHVVYGPRRIDGIAPPLPSAAVIPLSDDNAVRPPTSIAISTKSPAITRLTDPDDTTHPLYKASSRLTSQVRLSSDEMPIIVSPVDPSPLASRLAPSSSSTVVLPPNTPLLRNISSSALSTTSSVASHSGETPSSNQLLPPTLLHAPAAAIPIPLDSVPSPTIAASIRAAAVDIGAGPEGVPTLIKWQNEDGQRPAANGKPAQGPAQVFVTGTWAKGWKTKVELRKINASDFSVLISLPAGPHRLKFIVDKEWKASKHLPAATDADGNLINYLHVKGTSKSTTPWSEWTSGSPAKSTTPIPLGSSPSTLPSTPWTTTVEDELDDTWNAADDSEWTREIPPELMEWGEWEAQREAMEIAAENAIASGSGVTSLVPSLPPPPTSGVPPPSLPAQLEKGPLNHAAYVTQGSGDDNSILPKPDHSVINHLAASPIKGGFLSVGVTTRYKRKFVTIVYYKALNP